MATDVAIGQRRKDAIKRIEAAIAGDTDYRLEVPKKAQYGQAMMVLQIIETIADYIENAPKQAPETEAITVIPAKYLLAEELARNGATKAEIIEALLSEDKPVSALNAGQVVDLNGNSDGLLAPEKEL